MMTRRIEKSLLLTILSTNFMWKESIARIMKMMVSRLGIGDAEFLEETQS